MCAHSEQNKINQKNTQDALTRCQDAIEAKNCTENVRNDNV